MGIINKKLSYDLPCNLSLENSLVYIFPDCTFPRSVQLVSMLYKTTKDGNDFLLQRKNCARHHFPRADRNKIISAVYYTGGYLQKKLLRISKKLMCIVTHLSKLLSPIVVTYISRSVMVMAGTLQQLIHNQNGASCSNFHRYD